MANVLNNKNGFTIPLTNSSPHSNGNIQSNHWPEHISSWFSWLIFNWVGIIISKGYENPLRVDDLFELPEYMKVNSCINDLQNNFEYYKSSRFALFWSILSTFKRSYFYSLFVLRAIVLILVLSKPLILRSFLQKISTGEIRLAFYW
jgi:hypothetical protein